MDKFMGKQLIVHGFFLQRIKRIKLFDKWTGNIAVQLNMG